MLMRKLVLLCLCCSLMAPPAIVSARGQDNGQRGDNSAHDSGARGDDSQKGGPSPTPKPKPKPGPRDGGDGD